MLPPDVGLKRWTTVWAGPASPPPAMGLERLCLANSASRRHSSAQSGSLVSTNARCAFSAKSVASIQRPSVARCSARRSRSRARRDNQFFLCFKNRCPTHPGLTLSTSSSATRRDWAARLLKSVCSLANSWSSARAIQHSAFASGTVVTAVMVRLTRLRHLRRTISGSASAASIPPRSWRIDAASPYSRSASRQPAAACQPAASSSRPASWSVARTACRTGGSSASAGKGAVLVIKGSSTGKGAEDVSLRSSTIAAGVDRTSSMTDTLNPTGIV